MTTTELWARRVAEWRASGLSSVEFSDGQGFSASGLRHWASRLEGAVGMRSARAPGLRLGRVVRTAATPATTASPRAPNASGEIALERDGTRVVVRPGFDQATLAAVLDVLDARGGAR